MIFVTLGTHGQPFLRLTRALEKLPPEDLVVQYGHSPEPAGVRHAAAFMPFSEVLAWIDWADVVITHAGVGSILCASRAGHTPIIAARRADRGEHVDDHQLELAGALSARGMAIPAWNLDELAAIVSSVPARRPATAPIPGPLHAAVRAALLPASAPSVSGTAHVTPRRRRSAFVDTLTAAGITESSQPLSLDRFDDLESLREDWTRLAERSGDVFRTWEWAHTWWRHFGRGRPLELTACRNAAGEVEAIIPLYVGRRGPLPLLRFLGHGAGDRLGPVCAPESIPAAAEAMRRVATDPDAGPRTLLAERLPSEEGWSPLLGGTTVMHESSPVIATLGRSWDEYLSSRSANLRSQVRRRERKLFREHDARYRLVDDPGELPEAFEGLRRLHGLRWADGGSGALDGTRADFHREFSERALERGWLRLWLLEADGRTVAAWYGFSFGGTAWYYQAGRDPDWDRASVGSILLTHTMREAFVEGAREYRMLRGAEAYKERFATDDPGLDTVAWSSGRVGMAAVGAVTRAARYPRARRHLARLAA